MVINTANNYKAVEFYSEDCLTGEDGDCFLANGEVGKIIKNTSLWYSGRL